MSFDSHVTAVARTCSYTTRQPSVTSAIYRACCCYTGVQPDSGPVQRCVVWSMCCRQYSEAATRTEHCSSDRSSTAKTDARPTTPRAVALSTGSSANRVQADRSYLQSTQYFDTDLPQPSHQTQGSYVTSSFFITPVQLLRKPTTRTHLGGLGLDG